jgi:glycosyltransferase involved in cell wall biosynthesis
MTHTRAAEPLRILELRSVRGTGGGPEKTILQGARLSDPRRFAITVCYIRDGRDDVYAIDQRAKALGVDYVEIPERHSFDPSIWPALRRLVRARGIDIIHAHEYKTDLLALMLGRVERVIPLSTAHGWVGHTGRERLYYAVDKRLLAHFPFVIAVSGDIRNELIRHGASATRIEVVLNAIDPAQFRRNPRRRAEARVWAGLADGDLAIGSVGRLEPQKRFDLLLEACARLTARHPRLRLLIAGEGSARPELEASISRLGLGNACRLLGHCADVVQVHHALDVFVQASDYEGTPNAVLEAMALETPIVATDVGGTAELAVDGVHALIVPPRDVDRLEAAIQAIVRDPEAATHRVTAARARVEQDLSFERRMRRVEAIYERLAGARAGP